MDTSYHSKPEEVTAVETSLYNRMVRNAFVGLAKSAAIGAAVGFAIGAVLGAIGLLGGGSVIAAGLQVAAWLGAAAGGFGAVAGIQSTRDGRRFFTVHEHPERSAQRAIALAQAVEPEKTQEPQACACEQKAKDHFQKKITTNKGLSEPLLHQ